MSYSTFIEVKRPGFIEEQEEVLQAIKSVLGDTIEGNGAYIDQNTYDKVVKLDDISWGCMYKDMLQISKNLGDTILMIRGVGEFEDDDWVSLFRNGENIFHSNLDNRKFVIQNDSDYIAPIGLECMLSKELISAEKNFLISKDRIVIEEFTERVVFATVADEDLYSQQFHYKGEVVEFEDFVRIAFYPSEELDYNIDI